MLMISDDSSEDHPNPVDFSHNHLLERSGLILHLILGVQKGSVSLRLCMAASRSGRISEEKFLQGKRHFSLDVAFFG
jgi:hypothetical protein